MSFFEVEQATTRLNRSELAVPGSSPDFFEKAAKSDTDVIFLDLEDAVAPDDKEKARENIIQALNDIVTSEAGRRIVGGKTEAEQIKALLLWARDYLEYWRKE